VTWGEVMRVSSDVSSTDKVRQSFLHEINKNQWCLDLSTPPARMHAGMLVVPAAAICTSSVLACASPKSESAAVCTGMVRAMAQSSAAQRPPARSDRSVNKLRTAGRCMLMSSLRSYAVGVIVAWAGSCMGARVRHVSGPNPKSQPELEGNRTVLNATKQPPAPQAPKIWGRAFPPKRRRGVPCGRVITSW
jgi:hypothetical protein